MPYTPPAHRSPASTASSSPQASRRSSFNACGSTAITCAPQPALPRSASYLTRHRRTPSAVAPVIAPQPTPEATCGGLTSMVAHVQLNKDDSSSSVRQSPPPVTGDRRVMPTGAVFSPPESPCSNSDDEESPGKPRGRQIEDINELRQLHEAISQLPRRRETSPSETSETGVPMVRPLPSGASDGMHYSYSTGSLDLLVRRGSHSGSHANSGRRISHTRSATEPTLSVTHSGGSSISTSDDENDLEIGQKPQMVRKKSGELVRPALRLGSRRRPSSMPGTPTFSKAVHFDSHLEHVRHFLQVDRPLAVSAGSSPVDTYDSETEYPFGGAAAAQRRRTPPHEWEIILTKFPVDTPVRRALPLRLERVWLSPDQKSLHGSVAVLNLAFSKLVVCRFTLDYWKTTSEVVAEYSAEILPRLSPKGHDRFNFTIKLSDLANLENKTLYFCIRYNVDGKEYWDNNGGSNFQVDFKKKFLPINGKAGLKESNGLPRSTRRANPSTSPRPLSLPASLDDFDSNSRVMFDQSIHDYLGEPAPSLRLKTSLSTSSIPSDNLGSRLASPSGQAFANRYDFGASLNAAMLAGKDVTTSSRDGLYMKSYRKPASPPPASNSNGTAKPAVKPAAPPSPKATKPAIDSTSKGLTGTVAFPVSSIDRDSRAILSQSGALYNPDSIASKSYEEIVSKYCFYVPKQPTQTKDTTLQSGQIDGAAGELVTQSKGSPSSSSSDGSPVQINSTLYQHPTTALRHSIPRSDATVSQNYWAYPGPPPAYVSQAQPSQQSRRTPAANSASTSSGSAFPPFASNASSEYPFQQSFPFSHPATAIRG